MMRILIPFIIILGVCCGSKLTRVVELACDGDFGTAEMELESLKRSTSDITQAAFLHLRSTFSFLLHSKPEDAVNFHREAKTFDAKTLPPLAKLHLDGRKCGGLGDIFYVTAVCIKQLVDAPSDKAFTDAYAHSLKTLITLTMDSGLSDLSEVHLRAALNLNNSSPEAAMRVKSVLMIPPVYDSEEHVVAVRQLLAARLEDTLTSVPTKEMHLTSLDEFSLSPTFYLIYQGQNDRQFLSDVQRMYSTAYPALHAAPIAPPPPTSRSSANDNGDGRDDRPLRVGFVSAHFRRHSICKLFCGVISRLAGVMHKENNTAVFDITVFSSVKETEEDEYTQRLKASLPRSQYVTVGMPLIQNRYLVVERQLDVLVYLDVGMDPATNAWAGARLAPIQMVTWGHPSTTGLPSMDYFVSSQSFYEDKWGYSGEGAPGAEPTAAVAGGPDAYFTEQLLLLPSLNFFFDRASLTASTAESAASRQIIRNLAESLAATGGALQPMLDAHARGIKLILCPQHLPKFHPAFDMTLEAILAGASEAKLVLIHRPEKQMQWRRRLERRWARAENGTPLLSSPEAVLWLPRLTADEYLTMLALGDVMIDPYPFGGGVTSLEALSMCIPVVTAPRNQTVPALTAGILRHLSVPAAVVERLVAPSEEAYIQNTVSLLNDNDLLQATAQSICDAFSLHLPPSPSVSPSGLSFSDVFVDANEDVPTASIGGIFRQTEAVHDWALALKHVAGA